MAKEDFCVKFSKRLLDRKNANAYTEEVNFGVVKVSTGVVKLEKLSAGDASNHKLKINAEDNLAYAA